VGGCVIESGDGVDGVEGFREGGGGLVLLNFVGGFVGGRGGGEGGCGWRGNDGSEMRDSRSERE